MNAAEIRADILQWQDRLQTLKLRPVTRYSQASRSAYIVVPLKLSKAEYPAELLGDLQTIGIVLLGAWSATLDGAPATMGLVGSQSVPQAAPAPVPMQVDPAPIPDPDAPVPTPISIWSSTSISTAVLAYSPMYTLSNNGSNISGPARTQNTMPTALAIARTSEWALTPSEYRALFPEDTGMGTSPVYTTL